MSEDAIAFEDPIKKKTKVHRKEKTYRPIVETPQLIPC